MLLDRLLIEIVQHSLLVQFLLHEILVNSLYLLECCIYLARVKRLLELLEIESRAVLHFSLARGGELDEPLVGLSTSCENGGGVDVD